MRDIRNFAIFDQTTYTPPKRPILRWVVVACAIILVCAVGTVLYAKTALTPPATFPIGEDITIEEGLTVSAIADVLSAQGVIRSSLAFYLYMEYAYQGTYIQAGTYRFDEPLRVAEVARILTNGEERSPTVKVTFPEGFTIKNMAVYLGDVLSIPDTVSIMQYEGYLFPDTYFISRDTTFENLLTTMRETYEDKITPLRDQIAASGLSEPEVITLASLLEREANDSESMRMVAGILSNRLKIGMPLQVDATLEYLTGRTSAELTPDDLETDSPYNTYVHSGLPPTPIANPGIEAITAVLEATSSPYLYYLTGKDGNFYYAKTFEEHKQNKARYLR